MTPPLRLNRGHWSFCPRAYRRVQLRVAMRKWSVTATVAAPALVLLLGVSMAALP